jgi:lysyl-tRNA synthetase class 2
VEEAFIEHAGFSILSALDTQSLRAQLGERGIRYVDDDSWDDLFHRVFLERVEPQLLADPQPLILHSYPAPLASLARLAPEDARVSERFEVFIGSLELCNGFGELTCPQEQRKRFEHDKALRAAQGMHDYPLPEGFLSALDRLPSSSGNALGLERLLMILMGSTELTDTLWLPWKDA